MASFEDIRVDELVPEQIRDSAQNLIDFLEVYYDQPGDASSFVDFISRNRDIDQVANPKFIDALAQTIAKGIPESGVVEKTFLLKRLVDYYNLKGTSDSIIIFFQLFYDSIVTVNEPWKRVAESSSANYRERQLLRIKPKDGVDPLTLVGKRITQKNQYGALFGTGLVQEVTIEQYDELLYTLNFDADTVDGRFIENLSIYEGSTDYGQVYRSLKNIKINNGGSGFSIGDILFLSDEPLATFQAQVVSIGTQGEILKFKLLTRGSGQIGNSVDFQRPGQNLEYRLKPADGRDAYNPYNVDLSDPTKNLNITLEFDILVNNPGSTTNNKGLLSDNIVLQDGRYYNKFAYEIDSRIPYSIYQKLYNDLIHPAGYTIFNNLKIETTPPVDFKSSNNILELNKVTSSYLQPGGRYRNYTIYGGDISNNTPDENIYCSPYETIGRENYSYYQSPMALTILANINGPTSGFTYDTTNDTPKTSYFAEDFVSSSPAPREIDVASGTFIGKYIQGGESSPGILSFVKTSENHRDAMVAHFGKINQRPFWYSNNSGSSGTDETIIAYDAQINDSSGERNSSWIIVKRGSGGSLVKTGLSGSLNGPYPTTHSSGSTEVTIAYGNIVQDDGFINKFR